MEKIDTVHSLYTTIADYSYFHCYDNEWEIRTTRGSGWSGLFMVYCRYEIVKNVEGKQLPAIPLKFDLPYVQKQGDIIVPA